MSRAIHLYYRFLSVLVTALFLALVVPVSLQILSRYLGFLPRFIWTEEIARFCFVWVIMLGAMIAVRDGTHFEVDVLPHRMPAALHRAVTLFAHAAVFCVALTFIWFGYDFMILGARQQSEISGLPMVTIYIAWPIAGVSWVIFLAERIVKDLRAPLREEKPA
jgi:TRAP-type C4-dicarboxylate transport system permease small subunit